jgi:hypothetical protein
MTTPGAALVAFREANRKYGADNSTGLLWTRMDSKVLLLTPNTTVIYVFVWLDTKEGPLVVESPPNVLSFIDDFWFRYVTDIGKAGPGKGKGGKYLLLPPGHKGDVPEGYFASESPTYGNWMVMRGCPVDNRDKSYLVLGPLQVTLQYEHCAIRCFDRFAVSGNDRDRMFVPDRLWLVGWLFCKALGDDGDRREPRQHRDSWVEVTSHSLLSLL